EQLWDNFIMGVPMGISVRGTQRLYFDLEFVPFIVDRPRAINLTVQPGLIWQLGHGWGVGARLAFDVNTAAFGPTPLINKSFPIENGFFKSWYIEGDFPVRFARPIEGPKRNTFTVAIHVGLGF